uniref:Centrosomal protein 68 n=1 Tax=Calidris pygmaea TaxID=425635 RepID=A0A8C3KC61_9CHAR
MAVDVGKSSSEASLSRKAEGGGLWDPAEVEMDYPELAGSLRRLLGAEEAKPCPQGTESAAMSGRSRLATGVTQGGSSCHREASSESPSGSPRARASLSETERLLIYGGDGDGHRRGGGERCLSSGEQQVRGLYVQVIRSASSFSTLSSEENGLSEELSRSLPAGAEVPSPAATTDGAFHRRRGAAEGRVPKPFRPLLDDHAIRERIREMSSYQADYWACAIPDSLPPSPDRRSPHWNPHKEYEDLLDYAYPLKPRYKLGKVPEPFLHDSGIGLDSFSVSPEGTSRSTKNGRRRFVASAARSSTPGPGKRGCSGAGSSYEPLPVAKSASSQPSRGLAEDVTAEPAGLGSPGRPSAGGRSWCSRGSPFPNHKGQAKSASRFLPTTRVLPLRKEWEEEEDDEEFLSLPPRLRELERLAHFLSDLSLTIRTPGQDHRHLPGHSQGRQPLPSASAPLGEAGGRDKRGNIEDRPGLWNPCRSRKLSWENPGWCGQIRRDSLRGLRLPTGLGDALDGTCLNELRVKGRGFLKPRWLTYCCPSSTFGQVFCCQLEELIRWLYGVADVTEAALLFSFPSQEFRKDVANHRSLTESVLERGEALLDCMASNSPALKDTLGLIAKQSAELESHAERLYESVRAALMKPKKGLRAMAAPRREDPVTRGGEGGQQAQRLPKSLGQRGQKGKGNFLVGWVWFSPQRKKFCVPSRGGEGKRVNSGVKIRARKLVG